LKSVTAEFGQFRNKLSLVERERDQLKDDIAAAQKQKQQQQAGEDDLRPSCFSWKRIYLRQRPSSRKP